MDDDNVILKFFVPPILALTLGAVAVVLSHAMGLPLFAGVVLGVAGVCAGWWLGKQLEDL